MATSSTKQACVKAIGQFSSVEDKITMTQFLRKIETNCKLFEVTSDDDKCEITKIVISCHDISLTANLDEAEIGTDFTKLKELFANCVRAE